MLGTKILELTSRDKYGDLGGYLHRLSLKQQSLSCCFGIFWSGLGVSYQNEHPKHTV